LGQAGFEVRTDHHPESPAKGRRERVGRG
jgi:hypothetical protein